MTLQIDSGSFEGYRTEVPVGEIYEQYECDEGSVAVGDMVYFSDPDAGMHVKQCPLVLDHEFIGYVDEIYAFNPSFRDGIEAEVGTTSPLGRLGVHDSYTVVIPTTGGPKVRGEPLPEQAWGDRHIYNATQMAESLHSNYDKHYHVERHGGRAAVGDEFFEASSGVCAECRENEHGKVVINGE